MIVTEKKPVPIYKVLRGCVLSKPCDGCPYYDPNGPTEKCATLNLAAADAIEALEIKAEIFKSAYIAEHNARIDEIKRHMWIPVTERLPECDLGAEVGNIEWINCGRVFAGCFGRGGKYRDAYFRTWTDAGEGMDAKDADYWRAVTLPEPPKDDKDINVLGKKEGE